MTKSDIASAYSQRKNKMTETLKTYVSGTLQAYGMLRADADEIANIASTLNPADVVGIDGPPLDWDGPPEFGMCGIAWVIGKNAALMFLEGAGYFGSAEASISNEELYEQIQRQEKNTTHLMTG